MAKRKKISKGKQLQFKKETMQTHQLLWELQILTSEDPCSNLMRSMVRKMNSIVMMTKMRESRVTKITERITEMKISQKK